MRRHRRRSSAAHVHRSFSISGEASRRAMRDRRCESAVAIRAKNRFWRAAMRREADWRENFFVAKIRDSESALRAFDRQRSAAATSAARCTSHA
jgi:hypothetical protein